MTKDLVGNVLDIKKALDISREPVGVKYTEEEPFEEPVKGCTFCGGLLSAANGDIVKQSETACSCPGGQTHLGLTEGMDMSLEMLVEGEKLWEDVETAKKAMRDMDKKAEPPTELPDKLFLYPIEKGFGDPDLVVMVVNAEQAARLLFLDQYWSGEPVGFEMGGSLCWGSVVYPLRNDQLNITVGDTSARDIGRWDPELMAASIPVSRVEKIADALDRSTAGVAEKSDKFKKFVEQMQC